MQVANYKIIELLNLINKLIEEGENLKNKFSETLLVVHEKYQASAKNLLEYTALRNTDIQQYQQTLSDLGLSSLGRSESHVAANLHAVKNQLEILQGKSVAELPSHENLLSTAASKKLLLANTQALFGQMPAEQNVYIMVSLSAEFAVDYEKLKNLIASGMNCARINCAHDNPDVWLAMIENIKKARNELGVDCKILMDLGGPKLRTGSLLPGPKVLKVKPKKDQAGNVVAPALIYLSANTSSVNDEATFIPIAEPWEVEIHEGDVLRYTDFQGRKRKIYISQVLPDGLTAEVYKTTYFKTGKAFKLNKNKKNYALVTGDLPAVEEPIVLHNGDHLILHGKQSKGGANAKYNKKGSIKRPASISCTLPEVFTKVNAGELILLNDGKIEGIIEKVSAKKLLVRITQALGTGSNLRSDKGINFPDSNLEIKGLMEKDKEDLVFVAKHAEIVNMSFVSDAQDIEDLFAALEKVDGTHLGVMLKIETKKGFANLPLLLLTAMRHYPIGIMIARGDLAPEVGWVRLAEIQEEMLWMCEAAHIPVVWATQVLESLAQKGVPSRAEITDAAMGQRADCVMLNKGAYIIEAIQMLREILTNMKENQYKKSPILRKLSITEIAW